MVTGVATLLIGVITPFMTGRGPPCGGFKLFLVYSPWWKIFQMDESFSIMLLKPPPRYDFLRIFLYLEVLCRPVNPTPNLPIQLLEGSHVRYGRHGVRTWPQIPSDHSIKLWIWCELYLSREKNHYFRGATNLSTYHFLLLQWSSEYGFSPFVSPLSWSGAPHIARQALLLPKTWSASCDPFVKGSKRVSKCAPTSYKQGFNSTYRGL